MELLQILEGAAGVALRLCRALALGTNTEGLLNLGALRLLRLRMGVLGVLLNELQERGDGLEGHGTVEDILGQVDGHGAALLRGLILHKVARAAHMTQGGHGSEAGVIFTSPLGDELLDDALHARRWDIEVAAAGTQSDREILRVLRGRHHDDDGALWRLLHGLEQRVGSLVA